MQSWRPSGISATGSPIPAREVATHLVRDLRALRGKKKKNLTAEGTENTESQYRRLLSATGEWASYLLFESSAARAVV